MGPLPGQHFLDLDTRGHPRWSSPATSPEEVLEVLDLQADGIGDAQMGQGASRTKPVHRHRPHPEPLGRLVDGHEAPGFAEPHRALRPDP